jgi:hypothetical protein
MCVSNTLLSLFFLYRMLLLFCCLADAILLDTGLDSNRNFDERNNRKMNRKLFILLRKPVMCLLTLNVHAPSFHLAKYFPPELMQMITFVERDVFVYNSNAFTPKHFPFGCKTV